MYKISILIVEDELIIAESLKTTLSGLNYDVLAVLSTGEEALDFLSQVSPDVILMDINLPGELDGIKTVEKIKSGFAVPIIYLSAHEDKETLNSALETLPSAYIIKPYKENELRIAIELAFSKHQIEKKLKESEAKYRTLHETMKQGIIFQDSKGKIISANPAAKRILGLKEKDFSESKNEEIKLDFIDENMQPLPPEKLPYSIALNTGKFIDNVVMGIINSNSNSLHWLKVDARPIFREENHRPYQVYTLFEDITEQVKQERQLIVAKENAEKSDKLKTEFLAQMSHEIRTPINNILTFITLLKDEFEDKLPDDLQYSFQILDSSSKRLISTIELILNMSKIQTGSFETNFENLDLVKEVLDDIVMEFYSRAKERGLVLQFENAADSTMIHGDKYSVGQIFVNLIGNAIKYTEEGTIKIKVQNEENSILVDIEDTGKGISKEYLPKIFEPFTQEDTGYARRFEGTGLGLSLVKKYVELNKAKISIESEINKGSTFTVTFDKIS